MDKGFYRACAIYGGSFIKFAGNVLQNAGELQQGVGDADPDVDDNDSDSCPGGVCEEGEACIRSNNAQVTQQHIHSAFGLEHGAHNQKGNKHGYGAGKDEAKAPEAFGVSFLAG